VAAVIPNPSISGACTWDARDNKFNGGSTATIKAPVPTISDLYGRSCTGPSFAVNGAIKSLVSAGLAVDAFDHDGQEMTGITITAVCGTTNVTPLPCSPITVWDPKKPEYVLDIGSYSDNAGGTPISAFEYGVTYTVTSLASTCMNVKFSCPWNSLGDKCSVKVGSNAAVTCTDANGNCSNLTVSPKPKVGDQIVFSKTIGEFGCTNW
jgi:hypothetical protein